MRLNHFWGKLGILFVLSRCVGGGVSIAVENEADDIDAPPHRYYHRTLRDRFSSLKGDLESGAITLNRGSEKDFVASLLKLLEVPVSSQMLVFSTTSLQLSLISPSNPRALYFNEEVYVGYVPRGRVEVIALDPELGGIYYIFDIPKDGMPLRIERSERCMNCHAGEDTAYVPGLVLKSVVPGPTGGSLVAYRSGQAGHDIPLNERFGGWYLTGIGGFTNHLGNLTGRLSAGNLIKLPNPPGERFSYSKYPASTSDVLPQLLLEHQAGFVNRVVQAAYSARTALHASGGELSEAQRAEMKDQAASLARYLMFADEAPLPPGGFEGNADFRSDFLSTRRQVQGMSLKDFDL